MLDQLTVGMFAAYLGGKFRMHAAGDAVLEVELIEASALPVRSSRMSQLRREPFSVIFRGPPSPWAQQGTYPIEHEKLGKYDLFLVPIGPDEAGMRYQAIFN
jgi:hypothetical protein